MHGKGDRGGLTAAMKVVEYRIPMPLTVSEYKTGQLYMIQRLSQEESGHGEGVEILINQPYDHKPFPTASALADEIERQRNASKITQSPSGDAKAGGGGWFRWGRKSSSDSSGSSLIGEGVSPCLSLGGCPGTSGQYTFKLYRLGRRLPSFVKAVLPATALTIEEHAWNYFPRTRTVYVLSGCDLLFHGA